MHDDRFWLSVVSGWFTRECTDLGLPWLDHRERYRRAEEFIEVLRGLWTQDGFIGSVDEQVRDVGPRASTTDSGPLRYSCSP